MSRIIRFRAWDKAKKTMIDGDVFIGGWTSQWPLNEMFNGYPNEFWDIEQYIGLKDIQGKDIYEGDLLEEEPGYLFEVIYNNDRAKFELVYRTKAIQYPDWNRGIEMKIVGNIYENPELIKNGDIK